VKAYIDALDQVYTHGKTVETSHGIRTRSLQGVVIRHDVRDGWPLLTTKRMNPHHQIAEVCWYLSGERHIRNLRKHARYWDAWADENGNLQTAYGRFWRAFPTPAAMECNRVGFQGNESFWNMAKATATVTAYENDEIWPSNNHPDINHELDVTQVRTYDQVASVVDMMRRDPYTRRAVVSAWHPGNAHNSILPPCHFAWRLSYDGDTLNITVYQRSADMPLGVPYNLAQYSLLLMLLAKDIGLPAGKVVFFLDDCHIYENQLSGVREQINRPMQPLPGILVPENVTALNFEWDDLEYFGIINYEHAPAIRYPITEVGIKKGDDK
jgi:thymidylate synthase